MKKRFRMIKLINIAILLAHLHVLHDSVIAHNEFITLFSDISDI